MLSAVIRMVLRGKRILILESDYMAAHAIQRVLENEGATVHVGPCIGAMVFDGAIVDWGWARRPLVKTLSEAGVPLLAYTSDHVTISRRFPGCQVLSKPASDEGLVHAVIDLLPALRTDAAGDAAFAADNPAGPEPLGRLRPTSSLSLATRPMSTIRG
jgi:hypothetical protein